MVAMAKILTMLCIMNIMYPVNQQDVIAPENDNTAVPALLRDTSQAGNHARITTRFYEYAPAKIACLCVSCIAITAVGAGLAYLLRSSS